MMRAICGLTLLALCLPAMCWGDQAAGDSPPLRIHTIGTGEYSAAESLAGYQKHLEANYRVEVTASLEKKKAQLNIDALKSADLLLLFARRMNLSEEQMTIIREHCQAGKAVVALRTGSHAFQEADNEWLGTVLGATYLGPGSYTTPFRAVASEAQKDHPILKGVGPIASKGPYRFGKFTEKAVVIQVVESDKKNQAPAGWVHEYQGGRTFYSTMGQPEDFMNADFVRLLDNAVFWTARRDSEPLKRN